jgi:hypothetical protein
LRIFLCNYFCLLQDCLILMIRSTSFNDLPGLSLMFFFKSFLEFFFHFFHLTLIYWTMSFVICLAFFFCGVILISYLGSQVSWVNISWLDFFKLIFYLVLSFSIKLLILECCYFFYLHVCGVISGAGWSSISASPPWISGTSSSMVARVMRVAFFSFSSTWFSC